MKQYQLLTALAVVVFVHCTTRGNYTRMARTLCRQMGALTRQRSPTPRGVFGLVPYSIAGVRLATE